MSLEDFIIRFQRRDDLERVLNAPVAPPGAPIWLVWKRWSHFSRASAGSFTFKILVGI